MVQHLLLPCKKKQNKNSRILILDEYNNNPILFVVMSITLDFGVWCFIKKAEKQCENAPDKKKGIMKYQ